MPDALCCFASGTAPCGGRPRVRVRSCVALPGPTGAAETERPGHSPGDEQRCPPAGHPPGGWGPSIRGWGAGRARHSAGVGATNAADRPRFAVNRGVNGVGQNDPGNNQHNPQYVNDWAPRTRQRHQQEHRPQRPSERSDPTQHAKGRTGDCPGPRKGATTRRNVTQGGTGGGAPKCRTRECNNVRPRECVRGHGGGPSMPPEQSAGGRSGRAQEEARECQCRAPPGGSIGAAFGGGGGAITSNGKRGPASSCTWKSDAEGDKRPSCVELKTQWRTSKDVLSSLAITEPAWASLWYRAPQQQRPPPPPKGRSRMAVRRRRRTPPPPDQSDHRGKKRHLPLGKSCRAILSAHILDGSQHPPPPSSNTSPPPPLLIHPPPSSNTPPPLF